MNLVEVFVEENCEASETILEMLNQASVEAPLRKKIFHRDKHLVEFQSRGITIVPATFINRQLAFYGEFSKNEIQSQLERLSRKS